MPGEDIQSWSPTAALNSNSDTAINWAEGQPRASVNNSARSQMAAHAKDRNLKNGSIITGGTVNAQTFFSGLNYTTVPTGLRVNLKIGPTLTNTGAATLNMDNIGAVAVKDPLGADVAGGSLKADTYAEFLYNGTNWMLLANFAAAMPGALTSLRVFTADGTYPTSTVATKVLVMCKGGGGGGSASAAGFGGGGGEGATSWKLTTSDVLSGLAVTVGPGGPGGAGSTNNSGTAGGTSSIGTIVTAPGGGGGVAAGGVGGQGGAGGTNDYGTPGISGNYGQTVNVDFLRADGGGAGAGRFQNAGVANSGGGGGAGSGGSGGGSGGSGLVVCYEYGTI